MDQQAPLTAPPAPSANDTGVVPRWKLVAAAILALAIGWGIGAHGLSNTVAFITWVAVAGLLAAGVVHQVLHGDNEFEHIDARHHVDRALQGDDY